MLSVYREPTSFVAPLSKQLQPWIALLLVVQASDLGHRVLHWDGGVSEKPVALLIVVLLLGVLTAARKDGVNVTLCQLYGLAVFASGMWEFVDVLEVLGRQRRLHPQPHQVDLMAFTVLVEVVYSLSQLVSAFLCWAVVKDAEVEEEEDRFSVIQQEFHHYGATRRQRVEEQCPVPNSSQFSGEAHKLP